MMDSVLAEHGESPRQLVIAPGSMDLPKRVRALAQTTVITPPAAFLEFDVKESGMTAPLCSSSGSLVGLET